MRSKHVLVSGAVALVLSAPAPAALAIPPSDTDPISTCPRGYEMVDGECVRNSPPTSPPAWRDPVLVIDFAREGTDRRSVRVTGWTGDPDQRQTPLTVHITIGGVPAGTAVADRVRLPPPDDYGPFHGFDAVVPASPRPYVVCVTAVNIGAGTDTRVRRDIDYITRFAERGSPTTRRREDRGVRRRDARPGQHTNDTAVQQSTTVAGSEEVTETRRWRLPDLLEGSISGPVGIPVINGGGIAVRGQFAYDDSKTTTSSRTFSWGQPVLLPPRSRVVATITAARTQLIVPYTLLGEFVYSSGARASGAIDGVYTGVNGHDLTVTLRKYNPDGTLRLVEPGTGVHG